MILEQGLESFEQNSAVNKIFSRRKSKHFAEKLTALSAMDDWVPSGENSAPAAVGFTEVYDKIIEHDVWNAKFTVTREMVDDSNTDLMKIRANKMVQSWGRTQEKFAAAMLAGGVGNSIQFNGKVFDTRSADGVSLFNTAHPNFYNPTVTAKKQSNLFAGTVTAKNLAKLETRMQNFVGDKGEILGITPDTIIIPNDAELKYSVFEAIGADKDPATSNNGFNYTYGRWNVIVDPYWVIAADATDKPLILMDSAFNDLDGTAVWFDRVPMEVKARVDDDTHAAIYQGYARFGAGFNNWRGMAMMGVSTGTTL